ncbi:MAG: ECF transporter S component [Anaerolineales bacterium]
MRKRAYIWLAILGTFLLLFISIKSVVGQGITYKQAPLILTTLSLILLFGLYLITSRYDIWILGPQKVLYMGLGAGLYLLIRYLFTAVLNISFGKITLHPAVCIPVLFGFSFGPGVGFFTGAVGSLLADFAIGWDVFPIWSIASGITGMIPGFMSLFKEEKIPERYLSTLVVLMIISSAGMVFLHPQVPEPWTGQMKDFTFWAYSLLVGGAIMMANSYLMEQRDLNFVSINLWGALGIMVSTLLASLGDIWLNNFSVETALIGEYAPYTAIDLLNLVLFAPMIMAAYHAARNRVGLNVQS